MLAMLKNLSKILIFAVLLGIIVFIWQIKPNNQAEKISDEELKQRIGQMLLIGFRGTEISKNSSIVKTIKDLNIGGVILFDFDVPSQSFPRNIISPEQTKNLIKDLQKFSPTPLFIAIDEEGNKHLFYFTPHTLTKLLEKHGFFCINSLQAIEICENKYITGEKLLNAGLNTPRTALVQNKDSIDKALEDIGGEFPVIVKTLSGAGGVGVSIIESYESLTSTLQTLWKASNVEVLIQEKIESNYDIRIQVLTKKFNYHKSKKDNVIILGYMRRNRVEKDFRTNHSLGGSVEKVKITPEQEEMAVKAAAAMGCHWCGVDIIVDEKTGKNYILEVNASPGTKGLEKAIGKTITGDIIDFIKDKDNWTRPGNEIGFREVVGVPGVGDFVAKFDSGNGAKSSSIHADKVEIKGQMVHWVLNGKKFKHKIVGTSNPEVGDKVHERPIIEIDVEFDGKKFEDVHFSVVDRTVKSTPMLINRKTMERFGVVVNPQKTFVLTQGEDYRAADAKGEKHHGITFK